MKLFTMNEDNQSKLLNIISIIGNRIESTQMNLENSESFSKLAKYNDAEKKEHVNELISKLEKYKLDYDVLLCICFRNEDLSINFHTREERGWYSERDIPKDVLLDTINSTLEHFKFIESRSLDDIKKWYSDKVILLEELKSHYEGQLNSER